MLSDSFNDLGGAAADEADGALPSAANIDVIKDLASGGTDEGRAMMQIIHDIAPGASLAFYTAFDSEQDFANGILALAAAGCKVICRRRELFRRAVLPERRRRAGHSNRRSGRRHLRHGGRQRRQQRLSGRLDADSGTYDGTALTDAESFGGSLVQTITINTEEPATTFPCCWSGTRPTARPPQTSRYWSSTGADSSSARRPMRRAASRTIRGWNTISANSGTYHVAIENLSGPNPGLIKEITEGDGLPATISGANSGTVLVTP